MLGSAHMERAILDGAHLDEAILMSTHLEGAIGLTVEQLSTVTTLYQAHLDTPLLEQMQQQYPHLFEGESYTLIPGTETGPEA